MNTNNKSCWERINEIMRGGVRMGEMIVIVASSWTGKTQCIGRALRKTSHVNVANITSIQNPEVFTVKL